jgi:hypothetical protein
VPEFGAPTWDYYVPLVGPLPGRTFMLATVPEDVLVFHNGVALNKTADPGIGEFALAGAIVTTGFDVQPGDALWAHVYA